MIFEVIFEVWNIFDVHIFNFQQNEKVENILLIDLRIRIQLQKSFDINFSLLLTLSINRSLKFVVTIKCFKTCRWDLTLAFCLADVTNYNRWLGRWSFEISISNSEKKKLIISGQDKQLRRPHPMHCNTLQCMAKPCGFPPCTSLYLPKDVSSPKDLG